MVKDNKNVKGKKNTVNLNQKTRIEKNKNVIKKSDYIEEGTIDKKVLVVSLICAVLLGGLVYALLINGEDKKLEEKKDKKVEIQEKLDLEEEEEEDLTDIETVKINPTVVVNNDVVEEAEVEEEIFYTIKYFNTGDDLVDDSIFESKEKTISPTVPIRKGWAFAGWYIDETFIEEFIFGGYIDKDTDLYAKWVKNICYIADITTESCIKKSQVAVNEIVPLIDEEELKVLAPEVLENIYNTDNDMTFGWFLSTDEEEIEILEGTKFIDYYTDEDTIYLLIKGLEKFKINFYSIEIDDNRVETEVLLTEYDAVEGRTIDFTEADKKADEKLNTEEGQEFAWYYLIGENSDEIIKIDFQRDRKAEPSIKNLYLSEEIYTVTYMGEVFLEETEEETNLDEDETEEEINLNSKKLVILDIEYNEIDTIEYAADSQIVPLQPREREGYTFAGWYIYDVETNTITDTKLENDYFLNHANSTNITVVEKWIKDPEEETKTENDNEPQGSLGPQSSEQVEVIKNNDESTDPQV